MNIYTRQFVAACPNNGQQIIYSLRIEAGNKMIQVEHIVTATALIKQGYHEQIADELHRRFGGRQVLKAHHHGVDIETRRGFVGPVVAVVTDCVTVPDGADGYKWGRGEFRCSSEIPVGTELVMAGGAA